MVLSCFLFFYFVFPVVALSAEVDFSGKVEVDLQSYFQELSAPTRTYDTIFNVEPQLQLRGAKDVIHVRPTLRSNPASSQAIEQFFVNINEAYWEFDSYPLRTRLGYNTFSWGIMDGYSPLEFGQSRVYFDPLNSEPLGSPSLEIKYNRDFFTFEGVYLPRQDLSQLPATDSRWLPRSLLVDTSTNGFDLRLPGQFNYYYLGDIELNQARANNFGLRLSARLSDFDFSVVHFDGVSPMPQFNIYASGSLDSQLPNTINVNSDVGLEPIYYRQRVSGGQVVWNPSSFILRLESAYTHVVSSSPNIPLWSLQSALGLEKSFTVGARTLTVLTQLYYGDSDLAKDNLISSSTRIFDRSGALGLRYSLSSITSILGGLVYDFSSDSYFVSASVDTKVLDTIGLSVRGESIQGADGTLLGSYNGNDRVSVAATYYW